MQINTNVVKRVIFIVNTLIVLFVTVFSMVYNAAWHPLIYVTFYALIAAMFVCFFVLKKLPQIPVQYIGAGIMLAELTTLCCICSSTDFTQEAFILLLILFSLFFNPKLNITMLIASVIFYIVCAIVAHDRFFAPTSFIGENYIRVWMMFLSEVFITVIVCAINKLKIRMTYKTQSSEDLLKLV